MATNDPLADGSTFQAGQEDPGGAHMVKSKMMWHPNSIELQPGPGDTFSLSSKTEIQGTQAQCC